MLRCDYHHVQERVTIFADPVALELRAIAKDLVDMLRAFPGKAKVMEKLRRAFLAGRGYRTILDHDDVVFFRDWDVTMFKDFEFFEVSMDFPVADRGELGVHISFGVRDYCGGGFETADRPMIILKYNDDDGRVTYSEFHCWNPDWTRAVQSCLPCREDV